MHNGDSGEERKELNTTYKEIMAKNFPKPKERNRHPGPTRSEVGNHSHTNMISKPAVVRVQMQDIENALEIKDHQLKSNLVYIQTCYIRASW